MKIILSALVMLASASAFAAPNCGGKLGACPSTLPDYTGPAVAGPQYPVPFYDAHNPQPNRGPEYTGCVDGTLSTLTVYDGTYAGGVANYEVETVVCQDNQWVVAK